MAVLHANGALDLMSHEEKMAQIIPPCGSSSPQHNVGWQMRDGIIHLNAGAHPQWRDRLPTVVGLTIIIGLVIFDLVSALLEPGDWTASLGVRMYRVTGDSYWVDPQSLGRVKRAVIISAGNNWLLAMVLVLIVLFWEKRPLKSIGLRMPKSADVLPAFGALVAFYLIGFVGNSLGSASNPKAFPIFYALPRLVRLWMLSVLVCEEIMFRGYFIERFEQLTGRTWIATALSCILFGLAHASGWGFGYIFVVAAVGASYATLYVWRRNLPACMIVHFVTDMPLLWLPLSPIFWLSRL
jgi:uncharacterized protein